VPATRVVDGRAKLGAREGLGDGFFTTVSFVLHVQVVLARLEKILDHSTSRGEVLSEHDGGDHHVVAVLGLIDVDVAGGHGVLRSRWTFAATSWGWDSSFTPIPCAKSTILQVCMGRDGSEMGCTRL